MANRRGVQVPILADIKTYFRHKTERVFETGARMDEPLKGWQTMDAGRELDALIAGRLGYRVQWHKTRLAEGYALFAPDGEPVENDDGFVNVYHLPDQPYSEILEYSMSVDDALTLIPAGTVFELTHDYLTDERPSVMCWFASWPFSTNRQKATTPALAICRAFLAWQDELATRRDL